MTRTQLEQYRSLIYEVEEIRHRIDRLENKIAKLSQIGTVKDKVYGGEGGIQSFVIEGVPTFQYDSLMKKLRVEKIKLLEYELSLSEEQEEIEKFINGIEDSETRRIFRKTFYEGKTQEEIGKELFIDRSNISRKIAKYLENS